eukprot:Rmarinus@m.22770
MSASAKPGTGCRKTDPARRVRSTRTRQPWGTVSARGVRRTRGAHGEARRMTTAPVRLCTNRARVRAHAPQASRTRVRVTCWTGTGSLLWAASPVRLLAPRFASQTSAEMLFLGCWRPSRVALCSWTGLLRLRPCACKMRQQHGLCPK